MAQSTFQGQICTNWLAPRGPTASRMRRCKQIIATAAKYRGSGPAKRSTTPSANSVAEARAASGSKARCLRGGKIGSNGTPHASEGAVSNVSVELSAQSHVRHKKSYDEMATRDKKDARKKANQYALGARRSNWKQANAAELNKIAGIKKQKSMFKCPKCGSVKVDSFPLQTRSADEPMTIFCTCQECNHSFRR